jgi:hypothetical protein
MDDADLAARVLDALQRARTAHTEGRFLDIFSDELLERDIHAANSDYRKHFMLALEFLSGWADCAEHGFQYYPGFSADDWPRLAQQIEGDIQARRPICDHKILDAFEAKPPGPGLLARFRAFLKV